MTDSLAIVVVVRDRLSMFPACLTALYEHTDVPFRIIAVVGGADAATKRDLAAFARRFGNLEIIHRLAPLTCNDARRLALSQLRDRRCILMENDTIVHAGWLPPLLACAAEEGAAVVAPLILWHRGIHAAGGNFARTARGGLVHSIEYTDIRRRRIGYPETHLFLVDLAQVSLSDLCDQCEPTDVDFGLTLERKGCVALLEPRSTVTYAAPPPIEPRDVPHSLLRWDLAAWRGSHAGFLARWGVRYDASAKHASYRRQALRLTLVRFAATPWAVAITNEATQLMNWVSTAATAHRARRSFG